MSDEEYRTPQSKVKYNEENDSIAIEAELPGIAKEDLELNFMENRLTIKGVTGDRKFKKVFVFRDTPDVENIEADFHSGLLKLTINHKQPEVIKINVN